MGLAPLMAAEDFGTIETNLRSALEVGETFGSLGTNYFVNFQDRLNLRARRYETQIMPTGITDLDVYLGGGLKPKQLGIWMAPTSRGKSISLCQCGKRAVIMGKKVLHYTFELSEEEVAERYDSSFSKIKMYSLFDEEAQLISTLNKLGQRWGNSLIIKDYPPHKATIATLHAHYKQCERSGFMPDLILIDYLNLLRPSQKRLQKREELSDLATELRGWAMELDVPIWSATQSQRAAISMETHTEEQVGEDIGMVNIADVVITLNQTREEVNQNKMRLFVAKNRNGRKYIEIPIINDLERMCFYVVPGQ
jgi:replicative DNA helicase